MDNFLADFVTKGNYKYPQAYQKESSDPLVTSKYTAPEPGDIIFFDWIVNSEANAQHVGVVLQVVGDYVYTIEGNTDNQVAVRKYQLNDKRIILYGVLDWK